MTQEQIISWLQKGDVSIRYQTERDLLNNNDRLLQNKITQTGWGKKFLQQRNANGHWGMRFYQPKWTSTHYTLLDIRNLEPNPDIPEVKETVNMIAITHKAKDGGIQLGPSTSVYSDVCVNGMFLNYASYFRTKEKKLQSVVDGILAEILPDGGFNCQTTCCGATHSSLHTTISVLEGFIEYQKAGYSYRIKDVQKAIESAEEFILQHRLFKSDKTGQIIQKSFLNIPYPSRWKYNILRALDYFRYAERKWDSRIQDAIDVLLNKRNKQGTWNTQAAHPGQVHFVMEKTGKPSRWNTLKVLRIFKHFGITNP